MAKGMSGARIWIFAVLGVVVVTGFAVMAIKAWSNDNALHDRGQETTARVVEVSTGKNSRVHVEFRTADGRQVQAMIGQGDEAPGARPRVGDEVPIVYDPESPTDDVRDTRAAENHTVAYVLLGAAVFGAVGVPLAVWAQSRRRRLTGARR
jgi:Protein of unknown function (DUF3592)